MKVFMLGWEFPPFISGGLGTACYGLTRAMDQLGMEVTFVLPKMVAGKYATHVKLLTPESRTSDPSFSFTDMKNVKFCPIGSMLQPYSTPETYHQRIEETLRQKQLLHGGKISSASQLMVHSLFRERGCILTRKGSIRKCLAGSLRIFST